MQFQVRKNISYYHILFLNQWCRGTQDILFPICLNSEITVFLNFGQFAPHNRKNQEKKAITLKKMNTSINLVFKS